MADYRNYRLNLTFKSPFVTSLQSDTLFGHICWALLYLNSKKYLEDFLASYKKQPPLLVSEGFPKGMLPKPVWEPINKEDALEIFNSKDINTFDGAQYLKLIKKRTLIPFEMFDRLKLNISSRNIFVNLLDYLRENETYRQRVQEQFNTTYHNTINRLSGTVTEGLYTVKETFYADNYQAEIYLRSKDLSKSELINIFKYISISGFGKDKSTGKGHFEFQESDIEEFRIENADDANGFITLSSYVPNANAPISGFYDLLIKYPKLGGDFETVFEDVTSPFKYPMAMMRSGAVFQGFHPDTFYGGLIEGVHKQNGSIKQYAYAFPIGIKIEEHEN